MADDKSKRGWQDRSKFNKNEPHEVRYLVDKLANSHPKAPKPAVTKAVLDSANVKQFHQSRKMIENSANLKLKKYK